MSARLAHRCLRVVLVTLATVTWLVAGAAAPGSRAAVSAPDASIVVDAKTGKTLYASNADAKRYPASLTKMMTLYLLFEALDRGALGLDTRITVSANAAAQAPTKLGLKAGSTISVRDAMLSLITKSANDMAVAIGERLGGSESEFAAMMTRKARDLGMASTTFRNASGLPDTKQVTTARDMATLGRALREHYPEYFGYFATRSFVWNGVRISNHNPLLGEVDGVDGIKTGYTRASGYNLVTSVKRDGRELVAVVIGGDTSAWRDARMAELVETYLPKASAGRRTAEAIPGGPGATIALDQAPLPRLRPDDASFTATSVADLISADSTFAPPVFGEGDAETDTEVAADAFATPPAPTAPTAPTVPAAGWKVQIAAAPTQAAAEAVLARAAAALPTLLAAAAPYTEPVDVEGDTLYRARFAGFDDRQAARGACDALVKQKFACVAIAN
jgi:D-alanyl-D-alanine carboxypeptidase